MSQLLIGLPHAVFLTSSSGVTLFFNGHCLFDTYCTGEILLLNKNNFDEVNNF